MRDEYERDCAFMDVHFLRLGAVGGSYVRVAVALGSNYLVRVCLDALDGQVRTVARSSRQRTSTSLDLLADTAHGDAAPSELADRLQQCWR